MMLQEGKSSETEDAGMLPVIQLPNQTSSVFPKQALAPFHNERIEEKMIPPTPIEKEEIKVIPEIQVTEQVVTPCEQQLVVASNNMFVKSMSIPQVLQACQNFDFRYQRELLKSGVTLNMNPDDYMEEAISTEDTAFRLACAKYMKNYHETHHQHTQETEQQTATRRAQNAQRMRNYRQSLRQLETDEQAAERRAQNALRMRNYRRFKRELEPDLAAQLRAQNAERMRNYRKVKRELEPATAALRRAQNALRMRNYRKKRLQQEPE